MSRKKTTKKNADPIISKTAAMFFSRCVLWAVILVASGYGLSWLDREGLGTKAYADTTQYPTRLVWTHTPGWLTSTELGSDPYTNILAEIESAIKIEPSDSAIWDPLCEEVYKRASTSPWIATIHRVGKQADNSILIDAKFRPPFTYVVKNTQAYLVDEAGVVVRGGETAAYLTDETLLRRLPVQDAKQLPARLGSQWQGEDLRAGLRLVRALSDAEQQHALPYRSLLRSVDVSAYSRKSAGPLLIQTTDPELTIIWGKTPGEEYATEATSAQKLAHLADLYAQYRGLPADKRYIELRYKDGPRLRDTLR